MTTTTLYSNGRMGGYYRNLMKRNIGAMVYFAILGFVVFPLQFILKVYNPQFDQALSANMQYDTGMMGDLLTHHTQASIVLFTGIMLLMPMVIGLVQFSYLHSKKAADVYHSLPISRDTMILANLAAAFTTVILPAILNYLIVLTAGLVKSAINPLFHFSVAGLAVDLLCWVVVVVIMLSIIAFVSVQMGSVFDSFLFSMELLVILPLVTLLTLGMFQGVLKGFEIQGSDLRWIAWLSPLSAVIERYSIYVGGLGWSTPELLYNGLAMLAWLAVAVVLIMLSIRLYRTRRSEIAETSTSGGPLAQLGKFAAVYVAGPFLGMAFSGEIFGSNSTSGTSIVVWTMICATLIYVLAEVILQRGFKGLRKSLLGGLISVGLVTGFVLVLVTGGLGYESRLPVLSNVESVTVNYRGRYSDISLLKADSVQVEYEDKTNLAKESYYYNTTDDTVLTTPEGMGAVAALHKAIIDHEPDNSSYGGTSVQILYDLKNGKRLTRYYTSNEMGQEGINALLALENNAEFKEKTHPVFSTDSADYKSFEVTDGFNLNTSGALTDKALLQKVLEAARIDLTNEDVTRLTEGDREVGTIFFELAVNPGYTKLTEDTYNNSYLRVFPGYTNTIRVLREAGYDDLLGADETTVAKVVVYPDNYGRWYANSVIVSRMVNGEKYPDWEAQYQKEEAYTTTDPAMIRQLIKLSFTQRLLPRNDDPVSIVLYNADGEAGSALLALPSELPAEVLDALPTWVQERYNYTQSRDYAVAQDYTVAIAETY